VATPPTMPGAVASNLASRRGGCGNGGVHG
jgi:hypothetical protein